MKIILLYILVRKKYDANYQEPYPYTLGARRFHDSYCKFKPTLDHQLVVVESGEKTEENTLFDDIATYEQYHGRGWDCGTYQAVARRMKCDLLVCFNTLSYLWRPGWLEPFVRAADKYGRGVYGPTASYQFFPHIRTPCIAFHPEVIEGYPLKVDSREDASEFEHRQNNFSLWATKQGFPVKLVTEHEDLDQKHWRRPDNIFRRGDQSNCLVRDRHLDKYDAASPEHKKILERDADTLKI